MKPYSPLRGLETFEVTALASLPGVFHGTQTLSLVARSADEAQDEACATWLKDGYRVLIKSVWRVVGEHESYEPWRSFDE